MSRVPLFEQLEELEDTYGRMHRSYPGLVVRGMMRRSVAELHIERMAAAVETMAWLVANRELIKTFIEYSRRSGLEQAVGEPAPCVEVEVDHAEVEMPTEEVDE